MIALLYIVFIISGAAGLMYESIWSRYLGLFVGHSAYAQIIVLTIFLGGMSLGAVLIGRRSEKLREPLVWYAVIEAVVGLIGLAFHDLYGAVTSMAYDSLFPALAGGAGLTIVKWVLAGLLILPQSILLGMTFPLMSAGILRRVPDRPGQVLALLYFSNSLGAAAGVLIAGFYLIAVAGLPGTLVAAAILNIIVALVTFGSVRLTGGRAQVSGASTAEDGGQRSEVSALGSPSQGSSLTPDPSPLTPALPTLWRLLLLVAFGTAVASFVYEIAWIRMLSLVLGSATHSFELMLSAFILGLALGALWTHRRADRFTNPLRALGIVQWMMGFAALATLPLYLSSFGLTVDLLNGLDRTESGYWIFTFARYAFCLMVMLPATFFAGVTLPLITRTLVVAGAGERAIGMVYGINTLGSIVGVILAGLVLLPALGLKALLVEGAVIDMALGVLLLRVAAGESMRARRFAYAAAIALGLVATFSLWKNNFDQQLLSSGVFRYGVLPTKNQRQIVYYRDGRTATVTVGRTRSDGSVFISTNGKPDASLDTVWFRRPGSGGPRKPMGGDVSTQVLLPLVVLAHAPRAENVAVIGQGSGMTSHFLLGSPHARNVVTVEIEPEMIRGSRNFYPANRRVFDDPRSQFVVDDAKSYFAASHRKYDIILSEPSNPWVSGVSGLFTTEFYSRVKRYLSDDGVFGQWLHLYEINDWLVLTVLAALHQNFESYEIFLTSGGDMLIVASNQRMVPRADWSVFDYPMIAADLAHIREFTPRSLEATRLASRAALVPLLDRWQYPNSDYYPLLDLGTERSRFKAQMARGFTSLGAARFSIIAPFVGSRSEFSDEPSAPVPNIPRARGLSIGATIRAATAGSPLDTALDDRTREALYRYWRFQSMLAATRAPADWRQWVEDAVAVEQDVHGGTAGVVDDQFYAQVTRFLDRHAAPREARATFQFLHGMASWDFVAASGAADVLVPRAVERKDWLDVDVLRDGAVVAKLRTGDVAGARRIMGALASRSDRAPEDMRNRLLDSFLRTAATVERPRLGSR
ncbi:MAG: fused MFS/spermidine synthase [Gemmatimonadaceae bacterium]